MLDSHATKNIIFVYDKLIQSEKRRWDAIDDNIEFLEWLDDDQLYREAEVLYSYHKNKPVSGPYEKETTFNNFVKNLIEAVESICQLYKESNNLHPKNRYVLYYYLALAQVGRIVVLESTVS